MPLLPKRVKFRKSHRGSRARGRRPANTNGSLSASSPCRRWSRAWITNTQIEAARVALTRNMKRKGKLWIKIFPDKSGHRPPARDPHGQGQGTARILGGRGASRVTSCSRLDGVPESVARESLRLAATKLPIRTKFMTRHHAAGSAKAKADEGAPQAPARDEALPPTNSWLPPLLEQNYLIRLRPSERYPSSMKIKDIREH